MSSEDSSDVSSEPKGADSEEDWVPEEEGAVLVAEKEAENEDDKENEDDEGNEDDSQAEEAVSPLGAVIKKLTGRS